VTGELVGSLYRSHTKDEVEQAQASMKDLLAGESDNIGDMVKAGYSESEVSAYLEYKLKSGGYQDEIDQLRQNGVDLARFSAGLVGMLAGADAAGVNLAALTGENAAENNALFMLAIPYVITAISIGITAYEIYDPPSIRRSKKPVGM
jgi:filamentous hemagglutinin